MKKQLPMCKVCFRDELAHTPDWYCKKFEPRKKGSRSRSQPVPASLDYIQQAVRTTLSRTLHYVADLLLLDPSLMAATIAQSSGDIHASVSAALGVPRAVAKHANSGPTHVASPPAIVKAVVGSKHDGLVVLDKGQHAILTAVANFPEGLTAVRVSLLTGYKRSTRNRILGELKRYQFTMEHGSKEKRVVRVTGEGKRKLGTTSPLPPLHARRAQWKSELPQGNALVFDWLCKQFPQWVEKDEIDERLDFARSTRNRMIGELKRWDLIEVDGTMVRASRDLFDANEMNGVILEHVAHERNAPCPPDVVGEKEGAPR